jgi:hypothetical protein
MPETSPEMRRPRLLPEDLQPMTAEQKTWFDANRQIEPEAEPDECRALPPGSGRCAYAGSDGKEACGLKCIYQGAGR